MEISVEGGSLCGEWLEDCCGPTQLYDSPRSEEVVLHALASPFPTALSSLLRWTDIPPNGSSTIYLFEIRSFFYSKQTEISSEPFPLSPYHIIYLTPATESHL